MSRQRISPVLLTLGLALIASACAPAAVPGAVLGDFVWVDLNSNGVQDTLEPGVAGVQVSLYAEDGALVTATTTDDLGHYRFEGMASGRYFLGFVTTQDERFTIQDAGDDGADSDADPLTGRTEVFDFSQTDLSRDAGLLLQEPTPTPPPTETPTPTPTPVVPSGSTYEIQVMFVREEGACPGPASFFDDLVIEVGADGQTITLRQPSTGDVNTGPLQPDGSFEVSSERESYSGTLEVERDDTGTIIRIKFLAQNIYEDAQGCVTTYQVEGEVEFEGE